MFQTSSSRKPRWDSPRNSRMWPVKPEACGSGPPPRPPRQMEGGHWGVFSLHVQRRAAAAQLPSMWDQTCPRRGPPVTSRRLVTGVTSGAATRSKRQLWGLGYRCTGPPLGPPHRPRPALTCPVALHAPGCRWVVPPPGHEARVRWHVPQSGAEAGARRAAKNAGQLYKEQETLLR